MGCLAGVWNKPNIILHLSLGSQDFASLEILGHGSPGSHAEFEVCDSCAHVVSSVVVNFQVLCLLLELTLLLLEARFWSQHFKFERLKLTSNSSKRPDEFVGLEGFRRLIWRPSHSSLGCSLMPVACTVSAATTMGCGASSTTKNRNFVAAPTGSLDEK